MKASLALIWRLHEPGHVPSISKVTYSRSLTFFLLLIGLIFLLYSIILCSHGPAYLPIHHPPSRSSPFPMSPFSPPRHHGSWFTEAQLCLYLHMHYACTPQIYRIQPPTRNSDVVSSPSASPRVAYPPPLLPTIIATTYVGSSYKL